jgi:hypothetical protein
MKLVSLFLILLPLVLIADPLDVETLPHQRTQQYAKLPYEKIVVFSCPRTGSSLTYNVFRFLFEEEKCLSFAHNEFRMDRIVLKTHKIPEIKTLLESKENVLYVVTIRDPIQSSISIFRIRSQPPKDIQRFSKDVVKRQKKYANFIESLQQTGVPLLILKYEDLEKGQCRYLLDTIETHFHLCVSEQDAQTLEAGYSRKNIYDNIRSFSSFKEHLPISGFHGKHVSPNKFIPPPELLHWLDYYFKDAKPLFQKYGYFQ